MQASELSQSCHPGRNTVRINICTDTIHKEIFAVLHYIDANNREYSCQFTATEEHKVQSIANKIVEQIQLNNSQR